jgi:chromosome segregation ATPase
MSARQRRIPLYGGLGVALGLSAVLLAVVPARPQQPRSGQEKAPPASGAQGDQRLNRDLDQQINQAKEELELLELRLDAKRAQLRISEARLEEAKRWNANYERLFRDGKVTDERRIMAKDDVLALQSQVASEKADAKEAEMRLKQARRRMDYGELPIITMEQRVVDLERRLTGLERKMDIIWQVTDHMRRNQPPETRYGPR